MSSQCFIPSNPDIAGIGVRVATYVQNLLCFVLPLWSVWDNNVSDYELESTETHSTTNLVVAFAILISCIVQALTLGLTSYHASIVLTLSRMNDSDCKCFFSILCFTSNGKANLVQRILSRGGPRGRRMFGNLCTHCSVFHRVLKDAGARPDIKGCSGKTAAMIVTEDPYWKRTGIAAILLEEAAAALTSVDKDPEPDLDAWDLEGIWPDADTIAAMM